MQRGCTGHRGSSSGQENCLERQAQIQDRWESDECQVIGQPNPGIPVYEVKSIAGGRTRGSALKSITAPARESQATRWAGSG